MTSVRRTAAAATFEVDYLSARALAEIDEALLRLLDLEPIVPSGR